MLVYLCLVGAGAGAANAQCYQFSSRRSNVTLKVDITTIISVIGPFAVTGGGRSTSYTFTGNYTLTVGQSTQSTSGLVGAATILYSRSPLFTTVSFLLSDPSFKACSSGDPEGP